MNRDEAIKLLDPKTTKEALAEIEYYCGFSGDAACVAAIEDACMLAVEALKEVKEGYWYVDGETEHCSVCKLPWNYYMTDDGDDWGYFDPMPKFCPNCGAKMRSDDDD